MNKKKNTSLKKPLAFSVFLIFLFVLIVGTGYTAHKPNNLNAPLTEKTISSILSILSGNHFTIALNNVDNDQGKDSDDEEKKKDIKKKEEDPQETNGSRTSKKKANSED